jgi:hypothetical protein
MSRPSPPLMVSSLLPILENTLTAELPMNTSVPSMMIASTFSMLSRRIVPKSPVVDKPAKVPSARLITDERPT